MARAWPRAAQHKIRFLTKYRIFVKIANMSINSTTITLNNAHFNGNGYSYISYGEINGKRIKDVYLLNTNWHELFPIFEKNGEMNDVCIENGKIVTDPKRKAEIKENAKKEIELGKLQYEKEMKEYRDNMQKMSAEMQNMKQWLPKFYAMQVLKYLIYSIHDYVNKLKVKKINDQIKPKEVDPTVIIVDGSKAKTPSREEARQRAFDNLLSTLKKDLEPEQFSVYSSLIEILRKSQNGDPESITTLYNSMFQGKKQIHTQETFPPQYIIEPVVHQDVVDQAEQKVSDKSNDAADKSKDTINQINEEILQR